MTLTEKNHVLESFTGSAVLSKLPDETGLGAEPSFKYSRVGESCVCCSFHQHITMCRNPSQRTGQFDVLLKQECFFKGGLKLIRRIASLTNAVTPPCPELSKPIRFPDARLFEEPCPAKRCAAVGFCGSLYLLKDVFFLHQLYQNGTIPRFALKYSG